jgi:hypothetical protein
LEVRRLAPSDRLAFEIAHCNGCGYPFVVADPFRKAEGNLDQPPAWERPVHFLAFREDRAEGDPLSPVGLDLSTGNIISASGTGAAGLHRTLYEVPGNKDSTDIQACPNCGRDHRFPSVASRLMTGQDAPVSVLTEALYAQLPGLGLDQLTSLRQDYAHRSGADCDPIVGEGRKLLIFSDSRQNAAFMASYLQDHSSEDLVRKLAFKALEREPGVHSLSLGDWATFTVGQIAANELHVPFLEDRDLADIADGSPFRGSYLREAQAKKNRILSWLLAEVTGSQPLSLEALGLLQVDMPWGDIPELLQPRDEPLPVDLSWPGPPLTFGDLLDLLDRVFRLMRRQYLVTTPPGVDPPGFTRKNQPVLVREKSPELDDHIHGLLNASSQDTIYVELLRRWAKRRSGGLEPSPGDLRRIGNEIFDLLEGNLAPWMRVDMEQGVRAVALRHDAIRIVRGGLLWKCGACGSYSHGFLGGLCPERGCYGRLQNVADDERPEKPPYGHMFVQSYVEGPRSELRCEGDRSQWT